MPSITARLVKLFARRTIKRDGLDHEQLVRHLRRHFNHTPTVTLLPRGVRCRTLETRGFDGDLVTVKEPAMTVFYIHGGAYIAGVTRTYHNLAGRLAKELNAAVYLPRYPFAPEAPFPAAVNRMIEGYRFLLDEGHDPANIVISGDSAGGGLSLALLLAIRDQGLPTPRCGVLFSPEELPHSKDELPQLGSAWDSAGAMPGTARAAVTAAIAMVVRLTRIPCLRRGGSDPYVIGLDQLR